MTLEVTIVLILIFWCPAFVLGFLAFARCRGWLPGGK